jgi:hypothetical protein
LITDSVKPTDKSNWESLANEAIGIARMFEAYSCGDLDMEQAILMSDTQGFDK